MTSKRLRKHARKLIGLHKSAKPKRKNLLKKHLSDEDFVKCICECCRNVLDGNIKLSKKQSYTLRKQKNALRKIVDKKTSMQKRKNIIQRGGFLGALLGPVVSILGGLLGNVAR